MSSIKPALTLHGLSKSFGKIQAVDNLSLKVNTGEMVGFLGPNGAGKSTTLYMIPRLVHPSTGTVEIFGFNVRNHFKDVMRYIGFMIEAPMFYEYLTAWKNLKLISRLKGNFANGQIDELFDKIGLFERRNDKVSTYSQGMKQRLAVGATLIGNPKLLILDEPTSGMDPEATRETLTLLQEKSKKDGLAIFLSSHFLSEVEEYCDRIIVINQGSMIASGKVEDVLTRYDDIVQVSFYDKAPNCDELIKEEGIQCARSVSNNSLEIRLANKDSSWLNYFLINKKYRVSALVPKQKTLKEFFLEITG